MGHPRYGFVVSAVVDMLEVSSCESEVSKGPEGMRVKMRMRVTFLMAKGMELSRTNARFIYNNE